MGFPAEQSKSLDDPQRFLGIIIDIIHLGHGSSRTQKIFSAWVMDDHEIYDDYHPYPSPESSPKCPNFI